DSAMGRATAELVSAATMQYAIDGWVFTAASIDATIESLALDDDIAISSAIFLEDIAGRERAGVVSASTGIVAPSFQAERDGRVATFPRINGEISFEDADIAFDLTTGDLFGNGTVKGQHNVDGGAGEVAIGSIEVALSGNPLSTRVSPWNFDFDISAGKLAADLNAKWFPGDSGVSLDARSSIKLEDLAGFYTDTVFTGLSTDIEVGYSDTEFTVSPTMISVSLIDLGIPIENLTASVDLNVEERALGVENLEMTAFGGRITAAPFSFHTGRPTNNIVLQAKAVELAQILAVKEFAAINVTGTIGAVLPIILEQDGVSIDGGRLTGEPPGGVIRYRTDDQSNDPGASSIALVTAALSNFEYESLSSDVTYSKDGDLDLQMQLKGRNPDLDDGRPVVLNLGVENNVPQMLKSLQAARTVEEILENRLAN
ncbi:MAG: YdbH domain-containing protein, partial [Pseudomonadota bacterium]